MPRRPVRWAPGQSERHVSFGAGSTDAVLGVSWISLHRGQSSPLLLQLGNVVSRGFVDRGLVADLDHDFRDYREPAHYRSIRA